MKKILALLMALVMIFSLTACINKENKAKKAVVEQLEIIKTADIEEMMAFLGDEDGLGGFDKDTASALCEGLFEHFDYKVLSVAGNEDGTYTAKVNITARDMENVVAKFYEKLMAYVFESMTEDFSIEKSDEEIEADTIRIMVESFKETEVITTETEVDILVREVEGEMIPEADDELFNVATGNFAQILADMPN